MRFSRAYTPIDQENKIEISPVGELVFILQDTSYKTLFSYDLKIKNSSQNLIRYKIRSTSPYNYSVRPSEQNLQPGKKIQIYVKVILGDRKLEVFNLDKFQILTKVIKDQKQGKGSKEFWKDAKSYRLNVKIKQPVYKFQKEITQEELQNENKKLQNLQIQCAQLKEMVKKLKQSNQTAKIINKKKFIIAGIFAFLVGILFT